MILAISISLPVVTAVGLFVFGVHLLLRNFNE